jgi:hypothetical protein
MVVSTPEFQPQPPAPVDPLDALADLESSFDAQAQPSDLLVIEEAPPPIGRSWAFDFSRGVVLQIGGGALETHGDATLIVWMEKCLRTARGAHPIHPPGYGLLRPSELIGQTLAGAPVAELEERITSALTFHPRISDLEDFDFELDEVNETVSIFFTVVRDDSSRLPVETVLPLQGATG